MPSWFAIYANLINQQLLFASPPSLIGRPGPLVQTAVIA
jgi:hypothetical protein